jgi:anti-sigma-K factor RskA
MSEIHALSGAYAINALDDDERARFDEHLAGCADCRAEVASFVETAGLLAELDQEIPPVSLRAGGLDGIKTVRPLPPETPAQAETETPDGPADEAPGRSASTEAATVVTLHRRTLPALVAAAVTVLLLAAGALAWHPWSAHQSTSLADQIIHAPDAVRVTEHLPGGAGELTVVRSASLQRAVMIGDQVPEPKAGTVYQLWYQQPGQGMVSAGLMPDSTEPTVLSGNAATAKAAAVTVEPDTGSAHPTSAPIALFPFKAST